jgi:ketosteroid isomerase-like protein
MKTRICLVAVIGMLYMLMLAGCAAPATPPPPTQSPTQAPANPADDPNAKVVLDMVAKLNADDVDGSLAYFAEDAVSYFMGMPPTGMEFYRGGEALRPMWEFCVSDNFEWKVDITRVDRNIVYAKAQTWLDFTRQLGVAPNDFIDIYEIQDGKIVTYGSMMTEEALDEFKPAFNAAMPPEPTPIPAGDPVGEMTVTIDGGTCTTDNPAALKAGELKVNVDVAEQEQEKYAVALFSLDEGKDMLDLMASTALDYPPGWAHTLLLRELDPGEQASYTTTVEGGPVYLVCFSQPPALAIGNAGPLVVVP